MTPLSHTGDGFQNVKQPRIHFKSSDRWHRHSRHSPPHNIQSVQTLHDMNLPGVSVPTRECRVQLPFNVTSGWLYDSCQRAGLCQNM
ncbi:hypothetical protein HaLaN_06810 [Haematococcus lacustris]|uniref:Uncharacterized protein n=1 Tax=Haematococcus lacustris TaxID=44745 RepID=A0A699YUF2_HAELA|nr:hypothetical protein HaLaN_06810 [Haematococcus lacustris]